MFDSVVFCGAGTGGDYVEVERFDLVNGGRIRNIRRAPEAPVFFPKSPGLKSGVPPRGGPLGPYWQEVCQGYVNSVKRTKAVRDEQRRAAREEAKAFGQRKWKS